MVKRSDRLHLSLSAVGVLFLCLSVGCDGIHATSDPAESAQLRGTQLANSEVDTLLVLGTSGIDQRMRAEIRSQAEWADFWEAAHRNLVPTPAVPEVDLEGHLLIVAAMGGRPSGGYSIAITQVARDGSDLEVLVEERSPRPGCITTAALTSPLMVVRVPQPPGQVRFVEQELSYDC